MYYYLIIEVLFLSGKSKFNIVSSNKTCKLFGVKIMLFKLSNESLFWVPAYSTWILLIKGNEVRYLKINPNQEYFKKSTLIPLSVLIISYFGSDYKPSILSIETVNLRFCFKIVILDGSYSRAALILFLILVLVLFLEQVMHQIL